MYNPYIVVPLAVWAIVQIIKFVVASLRGEINFKLLYASGGMPSVHSAVVASLATTAAIQDGLQSHLFGLVAIFAAIVMYDSLGVRRAVGEQGTALNLLIEGLSRDRLKLDRPEERLREVLGHHPIEVLVGALIGLGLGGLFNYDRLGWLAQFMTTLPGRIESYAYLATAVALILIGILVRIILPWRVRKSPSLLHLAKVVFTWFEVVGWTGLILWFAIYERISYLAWRVWWIFELMLVAIALWQVVRVMFFQVPAARAAELAKARKSKWFDWGRKRKRK